MADKILRDAKAEAKRRRLDWADVESVYREIKQAERDKREHAAEVRKSAWLSMDSMARIARHLRPNGYAMQRRWSA